MTNSDGEVGTVPAGGSVTIAGEYGVLIFASDGTYTYTAYGDGGAVGQAGVLLIHRDVFLDAAQHALGLVPELVRAGAHFRPRGQGDAIPHHQLAGVGDHPAAGPFELRVDDEFAVLQY